VVTFTIDNAFTTVDRDDIISIPLDTYFHLKVDSFVRGVDWKVYNDTGKYVLKTKYKAEYVDLYNPIKKMFPTGRVGYVLDWCDKNKVMYDIKDIRVCPKKHLDIRYVGPPSDGSNGKPARPYQLLAPPLVERKTRGVLWHATASGKTCTAARIISHLGVKTLYVVPSLDLLNQTAEDLREMLDNVTIGKVGEGIWEPQEITVATSATLWSRFETKEVKELLGSTECLILDEVHHLNVTGEKDKRGKTYNVNTWYIIAVNCPAYYRVGLTGTPGKNVEQKRAYLECAVGRVISRVKTSELIKIGVLSDVEVHIFEVPQKTIHDYASARRECVLTNEIFNDFLVRLAIKELENKETVLIVTGSKEYQGPLIVRLFKKYGYEVPFVSGETKKSDRHNFRTDFKDGKIKAIVSTVYREGLNFPSLSVGILADGGKDEKGTIQFLGRILRTSKGKHIAKFFDFLHKDAKYLEKHSKARIKTLVEEELDKVIIHKQTAESILTTASV
jgi:superfamily II DNA or RNA helicase